VKYLLDVNVLVAWGWKEHTDHERVAKWLARGRGTPGIELLTSPIPELGFVRVSVQRAAGAIGVREACLALEAMLSSLGKTHSFIPDDLRGSALPAWCKGAARTTDAYLLALANSNGAKLATLDTGIPDAVLVPATELAT
jgi:predicted nucleic acid-binding protein